MNILHLLSNRKWTERAEPAVDLALAHRAAGMNVHFACGRWTLPDGEECSVVHRARLKGIEPIILELPKHFRLRAARQDVPALRDLVEQHGVQVIHTHMENAHLEAALARRRFARSVLLVNQSYAADGPARGIRSHVLHRWGTDGLVVIGERARDAAVSRFRLDPQRVAVVEPGVDTRFFDPGRPVSGDREAFGLAGGDLVVGMVTRIRRDRRPDLAVDLVHGLLPRIPHLRLLLVGRGEAVAATRDQVRRLGIEHAVVMPGYLTGDELVAAYRSMDVLFYPVPGTDQSCRTVREAMAIGRPVIAGRTGFLHELITEGETGIFVDLELQSVLKHAGDLLGGGHDLRSLGQTAHATAVRRFSLTTQAERSLEFYRGLRE